MYVGLLCGFLNLLLGDDTAVVPILNVFSDGAIKQNGLLRHQPHLRAQPCQVHIFGVITIYKLRKKQKSGTMNGIN